MIGIAISTHNRYETFIKTYTEIKKYLPKGAKLVVVDDASDVPVKEATFRFDKNVGIATTKNKCLELLDDCEHIFLFDDDCYPIVKDWWQPYVESKEPHLCYIFKRLVTKDLGDCKEVFRNSEIVAYSHTRGCMVYIDHKVLDVAGGMDTMYKRWGYEHVDWSNRIFNFGLTTFRYMDIPDSHNLFYSEDEQRTVETSVPYSERAEYLRQMRPYFAKSFVRKLRCEYKPVAKRLSNGKNNAILTVWFTGQPDPERNNILWNSDKKLLEPLIKSVKDQKLIILNDCFEPSKEKNIEFVRVESSISPYFQRWISYYQYLREHTEIDNVWLVDASDVEMLKDPFKDMVADTLYVGSEPDILGCKWIISTQQAPMLIAFVLKNRKNTLLNAGLIGGSRTDIAEFCRQFIDTYTGLIGQKYSADMGIFNYLCYNNWSTRLEYGSKINTRFKAFETDNKEAIWKHK